MLDTRESGTAPVFATPRRAVNRAATVLCVRGLPSERRPPDYLDARGASGLRGRRVAGEAGLAVTINDRSRRALDLAAENAARLGLAVETIRSDGRIDGADPSIAALTGRIEVRFADQTLVTQAINGEACELSLIHI